MPKSKKGTAERKASPERDKSDETTASEGTLPPASSIVSEESFTSPSGQHYQILHTDETDASDTPPPPKGKRRKRDGDGVPK